MDWIQQSKTSPSHDVISPCSKMKTWLASFTIKHLALLNYFPSPFFYPGGATSENRRWLLSLTNASLRSVQVFLIFPCSRADQNRTQSKRKN